MRLILFISVICFFSPTSYADYSADKTDCLDYKEAARILAEQRERGVPYQNVIDSLLRASVKNGWNSDDLAMAVFLANYVYGRKLKQSDVGVVFSDCMKARGHKET